MDLPEALLDLHRAMTLHARGQARQHGLSVPQAAALRSVVALDPATPAAVARAVGLPPSTMTSVVDRLEARGLVSRERRPGDRRKVHLVPTDEGRRLCSVVRALPDTLEARLEQLPSAQRARLHALLQELTGDLLAPD